MWTVQDECPNDQIFVDPVAPADVMLAGFRSASRRFMARQNMAADEELPAFSWGSEVKAFREWANTVKFASRPKRRPVPSRPSQRGAASTPSNLERMAARNSADLSFPSQISVWYAAKNTSRPGAYVHKAVADSYNIDGKGIVKRCGSLSEARQWLGSPVPRLFYEREVRAVGIPEFPARA